MTRLGLIALLCVAACSNDGSGTTPHAGALTLNLVSAGTSDGAVVVLVSGGPVTAVDAPAGYQIASNTDAAGTHIMVVGNLVTGPLATITVPDVSQVAIYVATVEQIADRNAFGLLDPARDQVTVGPAK